LAYVTVPKDPTQVKVKVALGLTKRQLICFGAAAAIGVPLFFLLRGNVPTSAAAFIMILVILPCFLFAMYEKHGRPLEAVLKDYYETKFNRPKARPYQSENVYAAAERQTQLYRDVKAVVDGGGNTLRGGGGKRPSGKRPSSGKPPKDKRPLTAAEKRQIVAIIKKAKGDGKPHSAQQTIPYRTMHLDGICRVTDTVYSKTVSFSDVSYRLAVPDGQTATFENLCDFYNYFDSSSVQLSFVNLPGNPEAYRKSIDIPAQGDDFDDVRGEYAGVLKGVGEKGTNGILRGKYPTFAIENDSPQAAKARLERIETDIHGHLRTIGARSTTCSGHDRLHTLYDIFHPDGKEPFAFDWNWLLATGMTTRDFVAPTSFTFGDSRYFRIGEKYAAASFLQILAPELNDKVLTDFIEMESSAIVTLHLRSIDQAEAIKSIKRTITTLDSAKINEQKKAVRGGWDMDILPSDLATFGGEAKNILKDLQTRNERMFMATILIVNIADTKQQLENEVFAAAGVAQQHNCMLHRLDNQQEKGLLSSLPLGFNPVPIQRGLTTSAAAIFIPFTTCELFQSGEALYYGLNALSGNMIMADHKRLKNPKGLCCEGRFPINRSRTLSGGLTLAAQADEHRNPYKTERSIPAMKMKPKRTTAIYYRTALADDGKIAAQERLLRAYAEEHDHADVSPYRDCGAAGNTLERPALNRLTADIEAGEISAVLVADTSRIARNFMLVSEWMKILNRCGAKLIAVKGVAVASLAELTYRRVGDYQTRTPEFWSFSTRGLTKSSLSSLACEINTSYIAASLSSDFLRSSNV
jgi:hypothetical protein